MRRAVAGGMLGVALVAGATGCTPPGAVCPAIGWINTVIVDASAFGEDVFVQLCVDAGCSTEPGTPPTVSSDLGVPALAEDDEFHVGMTTPEHATVRIYDASGTLIRESEHDIAWVLSAEACGGPATASPITLTP
ncbi:hypothetical protein [Microbacterium sp.]|uniref:hypothetical protein n=1 Tax=Microbacterium sp. TaxID=51671 RepID=UPI002617A412|nr:hypothetical protein [Microbacterium sp.]